MNRQRGWLITTRFVPYSIGHAHGTDDFLGSECGPGAERQAFGMTLTEALIPMGDWCGSEKLTPTYKREMTGAEK